MYPDSVAARHVLADHTDAAHMPLRLASPPVVVPVSSGPNPQGGSSGPRTFLSSHVVKQPQAWPQGATAVPTDDATADFGLEPYEGAYFAPRGVVYDPQAMAQAPDPYYMQSSNRYSAPVVRSSASVMPGSTMIMAEAPAERTKRNKQRRKSHVMAPGANNSNNGGGGNGAGNGSGLQCSSPTQQRQGTLKPELYKTELCRKFQETGSCRYGAKCQFAHGEAELRPVQRHPLYKTELCRMYHTLGHCNYGTRCRFIHDSPDEGQYLGSSTAHSSGSCSPRTIEVGGPRFSVTASTASQRRSSTSLSPISLTDVNTFSNMGGKDPVPSGTMTERRAGAKYRNNGVFARSSMYFDTSGAQVSKLVQANGMPGIDQVSPPVLAHTAPVSPSPSSPVQPQPGMLGDFYGMMLSPRQPMMFLQQKTAQEQQLQQQQFGPPRASSDSNLNTSESPLFGTTRQQKQPELLQTQQAQSPIPAAPGNPGFMSGPQPQYKFSSKINSPVLPYSGVVPQSFFVVTPQQQQQPPPQLPEPVQSEQSFLPSGLPDQSSDKGGFISMSDSGLLDFMPRSAPPSNISIPGPSQVPVSMAGLQSSSSDPDSGVGAQTPSGLDEEEILNQEQQLRLIENLEL